MTDDRDKTKPQRPSAIAKGSTRTDLRLTRAPADTPRAKLHKLAAGAYRAVHEIGRAARLEPEAAEVARDIARRGLSLIADDGSRGARLVRRICDCLEDVASELVRWRKVPARELAEALTETLVQLEAAEVEVRDLRRELDDAHRGIAFERGHNEQLRRALATEQVRAAAALEGEPPERWEERPTRTVKMTRDEVKAITESGDG